MTLAERIAAARKPQPKPEPRKPEWLRRGEFNRDLTAVAR